MSSTGNTGCTFSHSSNLELWQCSETCKYDYCLNACTYLNKSSITVMQSYENCFSIHFHAISCQSKNTAMDYNSFFQAPHKAYVTTSPVSANHTSEHLIRAWPQNCTKYPWHLTWAFCQEYVYQHLPDFQLCL